MSLVPSPRHTAEDLKHWSRQVEMWQLHARLSTFRKRVKAAQLSTLAFAAAPCYAGTSWGKDSTVLAHLVATQAPSVPLIWVRVEPDFNPDCLLVRDRFIELFPATRYDEIVVQRADAKKRNHGTLELGLKTAVERYGPRYLSGVRGAESGVRMRRMRIFGETTERTGAPIGWWSGADVFAYLTHHGLPIHPSYACTMGGALSPERLRVGPLGGHRPGTRPGDGWGRLEWEEMYYPDEVRRLRALVDSPENVWRQGDMWRST